MTGFQHDTALIRALIEYAGVSAAQVAKKAKVDAKTVQRPAAGRAEARLSQSTLEKLKAAYPAFPGWRNEEPDQIAADPQLAYVEVRVLPTFAGAGGGGTGDDDEMVGLVPRSLVVDRLRGRPEDFLLINLRGDSMEPDFHHDDQLLVDTRDRSPAQPGPFALWDGDFEEYVVKNVERAEEGMLRIFSSNTKYSDKVADPEITRIIGRPVWYGRHL
ncbi:S24 family peptidase [Citromicrobium bathyomarinum]|uniref:S24 family peptidase n=1 Tax=Citromicrobium bathyomarinum TaxID=72174 RepID=UPI00315A5FAA